MSERETKPMTADDVFFLVIIALAILLTTQMMYSCHAGWRYRDLRDRLERLEQRK